MFTKVLTAAPLIAAGLLVTGAAQAAPAPSAKLIPATYQFSTKRYCVRPEALEVAERTGTRIYQRQCLSQRQWSDRGITFYRPKRSAELAQS